MTAHDYLILDHPLAELKELHDNLSEELNSRGNPENLENIIALLDIIAQRAVRRSAYLGARHYHGLQHKDAVAQSNETIKRVRKALSWAIPNAPIYF
jgi:hypothetical protein